MTPAHGTPRRQPDFPAPSPTPLSSREDLTTSSHPTPTSAVTTTSSTPSTPQRGRPTNRYPDSLGRVPLHRRGTSKTYERLEDLLREAGYKETRVFTPETDRSARSAAEKEDGGSGNGVRGSVGAVVDFLAGLVSRGPGLAHDSTSVEENAAQPALHAWPPRSPAPVKDSIAKRDPSRKGSSESIHHRTNVDLSADAPHRRHAHQVIRIHQSSQGLGNHSHPHFAAHHRHHNSRYHHQVNNYSSKSVSTKPYQPNAPAYLRHMASAPNIQPLVKRPSLSEDSLRSHAFGREHRKPTRPTFILNDEESIAESDPELRSRVTSDENEHQIHPPLPRNWIESIAKALLSGVGGPATETLDVASTRTTKTASTRKSSALSDQSNRGERGRSLTRGTKPPLLCIQVQDAKASTSEGQVSCTRVMCRSTPTSRANSRVRSGAHDRHALARNDGKRRDRNKPGNRRRGKDREAGVVPSLARTKVENDDWVSSRQRYSSGWGVGSSAQAYRGGMWLDFSDDEDYDEEEEDEDEEEEEELGLDRLLVPARRQHSIQSLRKHLQRPQSHRGAPHPRSPRSGRTSPFGAAPTGLLDWEDSSWGMGRGRERLTSQGEGEDGHSHVFSGSEGGSCRSNARRRRGLPGLAQWTTST